MPGHEAGRQASPAELASTSVSGDTPSSTAEQHIPKATGFLRKRG